MNEESVLKMICDRAAEMWQDIEVRNHVLQSIEKPVTEEKIKKYMYNLAFYTLYVPVENRTK